MSNIMTYQEVLEVYRNERPPTDAQLVEMGKLLLCVLESHRNVGATHVQQPFAEKEQAFDHLVAGVQECFANTAECYSMSC